MIAWRGRIFSEYVVLRADASLRKRENDANNRPCAPVESKLMTLEASNVAV